MEINKYTVVFRGEIRYLDKNPFHIVSPFGDVVACGVGNEFSHADDLEEQIEALRAENARLRDEYIGFMEQQLGKDKLIARLREALKPILPDKVLDEEEYSLVCNFHLNAALMAYGEIHD